MARRSPMNERYQKNTSPAGKTRKSAAAAKPKRAAQDAPAKGTSSRSGGSARPTPVLNPPTPEYQRWRRIWWGLLIGATGFVGVSLIVRTQLQPPQWVTMALLIVGYAGLFGALYVDMSILRRLRKEYNDQQAAGGKAAKPGAEDSSASKKS